MDHDQLIRQFVLVVLTLFSPIILDAQYPSFPAHKVDLSTGSSLAYINTIYQDRSGLIWIGSYSGLFRYDGYKFEAFYHDPSDMTSISDNKVISILEDKNDNLWIGTQEGLNYFDKNKESFTRYTDTLKNGTSNGLITGLHLTLNNDLIYGHNNEVFIKRSGKDNSTSLITLPPDELGASFFLFAYEYSETVILLGASSGLYKYNVSEGSLDLLFSAELYSQNYVQTNDNKIVFGSNQGLVELDLESMDSKIIESTAGLGRILNVFRYQSDKILMASDGRIYVLDTESADVTQATISNNEINIDSFTNTRFHTITEDNLLWYWDFSEGLYRLNLSKPKFNLIDKILPHKLISNVAQLFEIYEIEEHKFLFTDEKSAYVYDWKAKKKEPFPLPGGDSPNEENNRFLSYYTEDSIIWIGTYSGIAKYNKKNGQYEPCLENEEKIKLFEGNVIRHIHRSSATEELVIATWFNGIIILNTENGTYRRFLYKNESRDRSVSLTRTIYETKDSSIWIGTRGGLACFDKNLDTFQLYQQNDSDPFSISDNTVFDIVEDKKGDLWLGTYGGGLNKYDRSSGQFTHYTTDNGLLNNNVWCTLLDGNNSIWMSSFEGLTSLSLDDMTFKRYTHHNGLNSTNYSAFLFGQNRNSGMIYIGGTHGIDVFHPDSILSRSYRPKVVITSLLLSNEDAPIISSSEEKNRYSLDTSITYISNLNLRYDERVISFEYASLDYLNPSNIDYAYKLEGFDEEWQYVGQRRMATYTNLDPGTYTFRVKGTNSDKVWSLNQASLNLSIPPPWWATSWAYLFYFVIGSSIIYWIYNLILKRKLAIQESHKIKEIDAFKTQFYTNITHEFRTPLTVIGGMADQIQNDPSQWLEIGTSLIKRNTNALLHLVNQLVQLGKIESKAVPLKLIHGDIVPLIKTILEPFQFHAEGKGLIWSEHLALSKCEMDYDPNQISMAFSNLLSNAIKFTEAEGKVSVKLRKTISRDTSSLQLIITDNGIGITKEHLPYIFDRFYQIDSSDTKGIQGTGIGLALAKEIIEKHDGEIRVTSEIGEGSKFSVFIPVQQANGIPKINNYSNVDVQQAIDALSVKNASDLVESTSDRANAYSILLVEDNTDVLTLLQAILNPQYQTHTAHNGKEGIDCALENMPDLIISDMMMPHVSGFELCQSLKSNPVTDHIPIILLTAKADDKSKIIGLSHGADDYITKPFDSSELLLKVRNFISIREKLHAKFKNQSQLKLEATKAKFSDAFLMKFKDIVYSSLDDNQFSVNSLCRELGMSRTHVHNKVKALTGLSTSHLIRTIKLEMAQELLESTELSISEVSFKVGFNSPSFFSKVFKERYGKGPKEWRHSTDPI